MLATKKASSNSIWLLKYGLRNYDHSFCCCCWWCYYIGCVCVVFSKIILLFYNSIYTCQDMLATKKSSSNSIWLLRYGLRNFDYSFCCCCWWCYYIGCVCVVFSKIILLIYNSIYTCQDMLATKKASSNSIWLLRYGLRQFDHSFCCCWRWCYYIGCICVVFSKIILLIYCCWCCLISLPSTSY